jgi:hypothetical protein
MELGGRGERRETESQEKRISHFLDFRMSLLKCWGGCPPAAAGQRRTSPKKQTPHEIWAGKENRANSKEVDVREEDDSMIQKRNNLCSLPSTGCSHESGFTDEIHANWTHEEGEAEKTGSRIMRRPLS